MQTDTIKGLSDARLAIRVASISDHRYVLMTTRERAENGLPVNRGEMIHFLIMNG